MADLLVKIHDASNTYINNADNRDIAMNISNEVLQLTRAVVKKYTFPADKAYKYHLAQPSRMLAQDNHFNYFLQKRIL
jgi:hypothetical protein